ncbi:MAG: UDP-N-acetylmuramoyl-L-alanyl-D-glutamate--2,6-diaminopimelate ligase [Desulfobulbaceae bacterium]|nr:UDP-N-acetylmuramoyl-L-alanyl-D-glutamate--2,6-diaminopimelate ligase [Desulfobulbaceae bacterium]
MATAKNSRPRQALSALLAGLECKASGKIDGVEITLVTADSRQAGPGVLFVAMPGLKVDGHQFEQQAAAAGCAAVIVERGRPRPTGKSGAVRIEVADTRVALGEVAAAFHGHPARKVRMVGITGTNGKTTTTYLLERLLKTAGSSPGVIGTVNYRFAGEEIPAPFTTPEPVQLQELLARMVEKGVTHVVMEVSSHALVQRRLQGVAFDVALFTNLSREHLDFHGDMESYFAAKRQLFSDHLNEKATAVIIRDRIGGDGSSLEGKDWGDRLLRTLESDPRWMKKGRKLVTCGLAVDNDIHPRDWRCTLAGITAAIASPDGELVLKTGLVGGYNLKNILGSIGVGYALGVTTELMAGALARFEGVPGRLERVGEGTGKGPAVFVDYAHTPDALENVLQTLRDLKPARIIVVFGCGGDRDRGKRPLMGAVAGRLADVVLVTSDNPRSESPEAILADIEEGLLSSPLRRMRAEILLGRCWRGYDVIASRREAIAMAVRGAQPDDVVLLAGKGHECYQITRTGKTFFDDRLEARRGLAVLAR